MKVLDINDYEEKVINTCVEGKKETYTMLVKKKQHGFFCKPKEVVPTKKTIGKSGKVTVKRLPLSKMPT